MNSGLARKGIIYVIIAIAVVAIFFTVFPMRSAPVERPISHVVEMARAEQLAKIEVRGNDLTVTANNGEVFTSKKEDSSSLVETLERTGVNVGASGMEVIVKGQSGLGSFLGVLVNFLPLIFFGGLLLFMMRQAQGAGSQTMNFGRSKAKMFNPNRPTVAFSDVAGAIEAKEELHEVVEFLKSPERFAALGAHVPRGVLLVGPPGTGKTLLARAVAGEAEVPFFSISGSEFVEMFVGVGASRVRDLFDQAKRNAPSIIFVDEIDAVGRQRGAGLGGGHDEREQTLNQILVELDGFQGDTSVIVLAATNRPDILDPALLRPGRFDRRVVLDLPDVSGREAILGVHSRGKPTDKNVDLGAVSKQTPGFSGADLANLVNEAAILSARREKKTVGKEEFAEAIDRLVAGPERKSQVFSQREKELTAYHEAGHAIIAHMLQNADPVQKISIVARGTMGGYTRMVPQEDRHLWSEAQFKDMLAVSMGGRIAEDLIFGDITTGASNDLENATRLARQMVTRYGMSTKLGPRTFGRREELVFLGREISEQRDYSDKIAEEIDTEVYSLVEGAYEVAETILAANRPKLHQVAAYLMQWETVEGEALEELLTSQPPKQIKSPGSARGKNQPLEKAIDSNPGKVKSRHPKPRGGRPRPTSTGPATAPAS